MGLYRCENPECRAAVRDFEADVPVCPECKADGRQHRLLITELVAVHYLFKDPAGPIRTVLGNRRVACMPARTGLPPSATGERIAVSCPKCRSSVAFKGHDAAAVSQHDDHVEKKLAKEHGLKAVVQG